MKAHYFASRTEKVVIITTGPALNTGVIATHPVAGKAEARRIAKEAGAEPWNF